MYRVMKPKGIAVVIIMNLRGLALDPSGHYENRYDSKTLTKKLKQNGFRSIKSKNLKALLFSTYYNLTSVYAYDIVTPSK